MYIDLLPLLPTYESVFLLDEDISLNHFDHNHFMQTWRNCRKKNYPLVVQPMVERKQPGKVNSYALFLSKEWWDLHKSPFKHVMTNFVEQQSPVIDSFFLQFFIEEIIIPNKHVYHLYETDFGADSLWCGASKAFGINVYNWTDYSRSCAVIIASTPVLHTNGASILPWRYIINFSVIFHHTNRYLYHNTIALREPIS